MISFSLIRKQLPLPYKNIVMDKGQKTNILIAIGIIFVAILSRFAPPYNFTAVGAIGLFGAAHFAKKWMAFLLPFAALWLSDLFLNNVIYGQYYDSFQIIGNMYVYGAFALVILFGTYFLKKVNTSRILISAVVTSVVFFLITNFGSWLNPVHQYPQNASGLLAAYAAGLPFLKSTLAGNVFFSLVLFKTYDWVRVRQPETNQSEVTLT